MPDSPARDTCGPAYQPEAIQKPQSPATNGTGSPECEDWTPDVRRPDPRGTRPQNPASRMRTKDQDFVGFGTLWDSGLRGTRDFVGFKTLQDPGLRGI